jgi:3-hydroxyisobutyrate dehydrogenase-like beta-hydroxyacid dehydrogenase
MRDAKMESDAPAEKPSVGFIGLGRMGSPMARNLVAAGFPVTVWGRSPEKARAFADAAGCEAVETPAALAGVSDVVVTMVSDGAALEEIYFGDPAFLESLAEGVAVDMSTIGPDCSKSVAARVGAAGVAFVEAPVSGSVAAAEAGALAILGGGSEADFERVRPLLAAIGDPVLRLGEVGSGALVKLAINAMIYATTQSLAEALLLAERGGADPVATYDAILASAAAAPVVGYRRSAFLAPDETPAAFAMRLEAKDLRLTTELAERLGSPVPLAKLNQEIVEKAIAAGFGDDDIAAIAQYLREVGSG